MIIDSRNGARGLLVNLDTGQPIRWCRWANLDTGEYEAFRSDPKTAGVPPQLLLYRGQARLQWTPTANLPVPRPAPGAPTRPVPASRPRGERCLVMPGRNCQHYGCGRPAEWKVADEEILEPEQGPDGRLYERAQTVGVRWYCSKHYRPPRELDAAGEVVREIDVEVRPG